MYATFEFSYNEGNLDRLLKRWLARVQTDEGQKRAERVQKAARLDCGYQTGALAASIKLFRVSTVRTGNTRTEVWTVGSDLHYALYVHEGVAPPVITAKGNGKLRYVSDGVVKFRKSVLWYSEKPNNGAKKYLSKNLWRAVI